MKKLILTTLTLVLIASTSMAQNFDIRGYAGINVMQLSSDEGTTLIDGAIHNRDVSGRPGYQAGVALTFGERFFVQPGVQFTTISTKVINENTSSGFSFEDETNLKFLSIPLKVGFRLIDPKTEDIFNVRVFGGIDGHHITSVDHSTKSGKIEDLNKDDYNNLIVNADFGMGIDLLIFYLDAGYQIGLSPVHSGSDDATANLFYTNIGLRIKF